MVRQALGLLFLLVLIARPAQSQDAFTAVRCGSDVARTLVGKKMPSGRVMAIETRHRDVGLKDEGGTEVSDSLMYESWTMCGREYALLVDRRQVIRDAVLFPIHSRRHPGFVGVCYVGRRRLPDGVAAVLDNASPGKEWEHYLPSDSTLLPATAAWSIDEKEVRFRPLAIDRLGCPRSQIFTVDGGP